MKKVILLLTTVTLLSLPILAKEQTIKEQAKQQIIQNSQQTAKQLIESSGKRSTQKVKEAQIEKIVKEAVEIYKIGDEVIFLLTHNKIKEAQKKLETLKSKIEQLQKQYQIKNFPINVVITEVDGITDIKEAEKLAKEAKKAVENNDFIKARFLLNSLRDEIVIETVYLPIDLYKEAVSLADKFLRQGKITNAISQMQVAMATVEIERTIIPKPVAIASLLVEDALKSYKKEPDKAVKLLEEAKKQIKLAKVLGYIRTEEEVKPILKQIENLEKAVKEKTAKTERFRELFRSIEETKQKATQTQ